MQRYFRVFILWIAALSGLVTFPAAAALKEGDPAPAFEAQASLAGKPFNFSMKNALKQGPVVVYFYPSAFTEGCNVQAHEFAVHHDEFVAANATIIGVSLDNLATLNEFSANPDYCGGKVPVASDVDGRIAKSYGLMVRSIAGVKDTRGQEIEHGFAERTTFIVTSNGKVFATVGGLAPKANVEQALAVIRDIATEARAARSAPVGY